MTHEQILTEFKHRVRFYMPDGTRGEYFNIASERIKKAEEDKAGRLF